MIVGEPYSRQNEIVKRVVRDCGNLAVACGWRSEVVVVVVSRSLYRLSGDEFLLGVE